MITHGCPIITEKATPPLNETLWSRLVDEKNQYIPQKIEETFEFLKCNKMNGLYRGHDHAPSLFVRKNSTTILYCSSGTYALENDKIYKINSKKIESQNVLVDEKFPFIFNPGPFLDGHFGIVTTISNGLEFCIKNTNSTNNILKK
jgi:hypothetical protein